jgi:hypothetical protein
MATFIQTINPTPFGYFDSDATFINEADPMVLFVKRKLGDDVISVELTKKMIWACFEEATLEYGDQMMRYKLKSELANLLGLPTVYSATIVSGTVSASYSITNVYPKKTFEFLMRQAEPYASYAGQGGSYDNYITYIDLVDGQQDYNLYTDLKFGEGPLSGSAFYSNLPTAQQGKIRVLEVMHFSPLAAQHFLLNASNVTNFLATQFNYESYVNSTVFYVLPVFEDILRRSMLETAYRVRRSNYSYQIMGTKLRLYPIPQLGPTFQLRIYLKVGTPQDPTNSSVGGGSGSVSGSTDATLYGISMPSQVPFTNVQYGLINSMGKNWIRQYTLALAREVLGLVRSKFKTIPIPSADLVLNGEELIAQGREDKEKLKSDLKDLIDSLTYDKLLEIEAGKAENMNKMLKYIPMPIGKSIVIG